MSMRTSGPNGLTPEEVRLAETSSKVLETAASVEAAETAGERPHLLHLRIQPADGERIDVDVPGVVLPLLQSVLNELGNGRDVSIVATDSEVSTQQAARFLNVSRPYVVKLMEEGRIPYRTVGPRRRVRVRDLLSYRSQEEAGRHRGLDELVIEAQRLGMY